MSGPPLSAPITLNCGLTFPNRLVKAAMAEQMGDGPEMYLPTETSQALYKHFAEGGWGMVLTGLWRGKSA